MIRAHQPGSQPIDVPETVPNPAIPRTVPEPRPSEPVKVPASPPANAGSPFLIHDADSAATAKASRILSLAPNDQMPAGGT